ncbi:uncharacterized protein LOC134669402 [Cydia fagiglandana]|uniref:uncharacterized protein LOC134669402 n=1 Tax=Cydia fagiglandana TaxID=1458189 RepID=UPI002FEE3EF4
MNLRRTIDSYLENRKVTVRYAGQEYNKGTNKGCVQGSIGGPILWNLLLDPLLRKLEQNGVFCQAFADDVVLIFDGDTALDIETQANATLEHVRTWGIDHKLKFAPHKTCAMVITRKLKFDAPRLSMGGVNIAMSNEIKILGLTIDHKLTFNQHVAGVCRKALNMYKKLARTARVSWGLHPEVIRTIYTAAVEPVVLYAASAWAPAAKKLGVIKQLNTVQRGFAQKICKAYRTVSLNSALLLAGMLPLDLRVQEAASLYEAKKGVPQSALLDREVERMSSAMEAPHPAEHSDLEVISLVDQQQVDSYSNYQVRIFTDGSKIGGKVGAALSIWKGETEIKAHKLALSEQCTVYQAELLALCKATREITASREKTFGIYSDSMAALQTIQNRKCFHPLAVEARDNLRTSSRQGKMVTLHWIKAHAGLEGNERADVLAKEAAVGSKRKPNYDRCPVSFVKRAIRTATIEEWNRRYVDSDTASGTKLFFPDAVNAYKMVRKIQPTGIRTQLMTGHGGFSEYLHRFKCKESPSCICDPAVRETVPHILLECPVHDQMRFDLEMKLNLNLKLANMKELITSANREEFLNYCEKICKQVAKRNESS